jgi:hypothetical protein
MERDHAAELTQGAQEAYGTLREAYDRKKAEAEPHRQQRKELKETAQRTADKFRCAPVRPVGCRHVACQLSRAPRPRSQSLLSVDVYLGPKQIYDAPHRLAALTQSFMEACICGGNTCGPLLV